MARARTRRPRVTKEQLHDLVDKLSDEELHAAKRFLEFLLQEKPADPFLEMLRNAPLDDEPTTPEEDEGAKQAWREYQEGKARPWEEVRKEIGHAR